MFKTKGGGQRLFEQCSKKLRIWWRMAPLNKARNSEKVELLDTTDWLIDPGLVGGQLRQCDKYTHLLHYLPSGVLLTAAMCIAVQWLNIYLTALFHEKQ